MKKKILFRFRIQSLSDIITNSSSELFVFKNHNMQAVILTLDALYPNWRNEYEEPEFVKDMDDKRLEDYLGWVFDSYASEYRGNSCKKIKKDEWEELKLNPYSCPGASIAEKFKKKPEELFSNWNEWSPWAYWENKYLKWTDEGIKLYKEHYGEDIALWSIGENPKWEYQEKLMEVAKRYHLG